MTQKTSKSLPSIRSQITLLVLACALPTVVSFGAVVQQFYARERASLMEDTQQAARTVAAAIDRDLTQSDSAVRALATSPSLSNGDLAGFERQAGSLLGQWFPGSQFLLSSRDGSVAAHAGAPIPAGLTPQRNLDRLEPTLAGAGPLLSLVREGNTMLLAVDVPVVVDGKLTYVLSTLLKSDRLSRILSDERVAPQQAVTLYDAQGVIVAQSGSSRSQVGRPAEPRLRQQLRDGARNGGEALLSTEGADGVPIYLGFARSPVSGATVAIATPQAQALEELLRAVTMISLGMAGVLAAGFSLAWVVGGRVARSARALLEPARALASGTPLSLEPMTFSEAAAVGQAFQALEVDLLRHRHELESLVAERTAQLEKSRSQLETLYATAPVGLSYVDPELRVVRINDYLAAINGRRVVEHLGRHMGDMFSDDAVRRDVLRDYRTVLETGKPIIGIERSGTTAAAPGQLCHWVLSYYPQFGLDGKIAGITSLLLDISAQKRIEAELHRSKQLFISVVDNMPAMIFVKRAEDLRYDLFNRYGAALLGVEADSLLGKTDYDIQSREQADAFRSDDRRVLASGLVTEIAEEPIVNALGETRYLTTRKVALRDDNGVATHVLGIALDITERKRAEQVLRATTERLADNEQFIRTVTDNLPGMVAYWDASLRCRFANRYFLEWYEREADQIQGMPMAEVLGAEQFARHAPYVEGALAGIAQGFEGKLVWPSGAVSYTWINYIPDLGDAAQVRGFFVLVADVTELKEAELHLQQVNDELVLARDKAEAANRAKGEFLANMSHEIRTPMNAIIGLARLLEEAPLAQRERNYLNKIQQATQSLLGVVNDVLDFSRIEAGQMPLEHTRFQLDHLLDSISMLLSGSACDQGVELVYVIDPDLPPVLVGDPMRLQQVLLNLLSNAIKFSARGEVVLAIRRAAPDSAADDGDSGPAGITLELCVSDSGIGIPHADQERIFEAFSQADSSTSRKFGGAGLGLSICRRLVQLMGGVISVRSEPGQGAEFLVRCHFEVAGADAASPARLASAELAPLPALTVLIVDDSVRVREALRRACLAFGWQADCADAGHAMLRLASHHYDLLLLDQDMPERDGPALLQLIHASGYATADQAPHLPPIIMMAPESRCEALLEQAGELGLAGVLAKPASPARVYESVLRLHAPTSKPDAVPGGTPLSGRLPGMRILLVEDNPINQEVAEYILLHAGADVAVASNGQIAVDLLAQAPDRYDVVLMDVQMPVLNGYDATVAIRAMGLLALPVVAMTANVLEEDRLRAAQAGMDAHVAKPIDVEELIGTLSRLARPALAPTQPQPQAGTKAMPAASPVDDILSDHPARATGVAAPAGASGTMSNPALPGVDLDAALPRLGGNFQALTALLKRFAHSHGGTVGEVRALLATSQLADAHQALHRLRGVAANLGCGAIAHHAARAEATLRQMAGSTVSVADQAAAPATDETAGLHDELALLDDAIAVVCNGVRDTADIAVANTGVPFDNTLSDDLAQKLAQLESLLQNNNMKAIGHLEQVRAILPASPALAALAEAVDTLDFRTAEKLLKAITAGKDGAMPPGSS